jgi:starch-binding outer membrane protein, SusD/RagB family
MTFNINKTASLLLLSGAMLLGSTSCKDFLDEQAPSNLTPDSFYTIPDHAEAAIAAVYADLRFVGNGNGIFSSNWQLLEAPTGTSATETAQNSDLNNLYSLVYDGNTGHVVAWWNGLYRVIANANLVLEKVPGITPMDAAQKSRILAEARFMRAWAYFHAVRLWGDVPLITKPQTTASEDFQPGRTPQEQIYTQIVADLVEAEKAPLDWMYTNGRVGMGAVKTQLSKVYLTMAGFPLSKGASHFKLAADKAFEVITYANANTNVIGLFPTYLEVHREDRENRLEHLFSLQYNVAVAGNPMGNTFPNFKPVTFSGPGGTGSTVPVPSFYQSYEAGDLRAKDQEGWFYTSYFTNGNGAKFELGAPYIFKHFNQIANGSSGVAGTRNDNLNMMQIRYAETLLIYAEAQNEVGGPIQATVDALKRVRDRAKLTTLAVGGYTQASFREAVWRERWYELCYEQITWYDMVRLRKVFNDKNKTFANFVGAISPASNQPYLEKHLLFPIPKQELLNNPNLKTQNPGYPN